MNASRELCEGETEEEAVANIHEAIELYLEPVEDDWMVPLSSGTLFLMI